MRINFAWALFAVLILTSSCQDSLPSDYIPQNFVEVFMLVDQPINNFHLYRSVPVNDTFNTTQSFIKDAQVVISADSMGIFKKNYQLSYRFGQKGPEFYYAADTNEFVKPNTKYSLEITLANGEKITGEAITPSRISWRAVPRDTIFYPKDTINLAASTTDSLKWTYSPNINEYIIGTICLDTLNYGEYLKPVSDEKNRRIYRFYEQNAPHYNDVTRSRYIPNVTFAPVIWTAFKWFGEHDIFVCAPDKNFLNWYKITMFGQNPRYSDLLGSVKGSGIGVFGAASIIKTRTFVIKNQP